MVGVTFSSHGSVAVRSAPASLVPPSRGRLTWLGDNVSAKVVSAKVFFRAPESFLFFTVRVTKLAFASSRATTSLAVSIWVWRLASFRTLLFSASLLNVAMTFSSLASLWRPLSFFTTRSRTSRAGKVGGGAGASGIAESSS